MFTTEILKSTAQREIRSLERTVESLNNLNMIKLEFLRQTAINLSTTTRINYISWGH